MSTGQDDDQDLSAGEMRELEATREALRDVYGTSDFGSHKDGDSVPSVAREQLNDALQLVPKAQREVYDEALIKCPYLVEDECKPELFLKACAFDPWAAAERICAYWQWRKELFGDRAFLPMDLTGNGAVPDDIVEAIKCGGSTVLPPDSKNRGVFYSDRSKFCERCSQEDARAKVMFYTIHTMMESPHALENGIIMMTKMDQDNQGNGSKNNAPRSNVIRMLQAQPFPLALRACHIIVFKKRSLMESVMPIWLKLMGRYKSMILRTVAHFAESRETMLGDLKSYCFEEDNVPKELGGSLDLEKYFKQWHTDRLKIELARRHARMMEAHRDPDNQESDGGQALESLAVVADQVRVEEAKARKRKLDAVYQKQKRLQRKEEFSKITTELNALKKDNSNLKKEQALLESLLHRAVEISSAYERTVAATEARPLSISQQSASPQFQPDQADVLNQLLQRAASTPSPSTETQHAESTPGGLFGSSDRSTLEHVASLLQSGSVPPDLLSQGDLVQELKSTMLRQQLQDKEMQQQQQQQQLHLGPADQAAIHRFALLLQQQLQEQQAQQQQEQSEIAKYLQQARAKASSAPAPTAGVFGQRQQEQSFLSNIFSTHISSEQTPAPGMFSRATGQGTTTNMGQQHMPPLCAAAPISRMPSMDGSAPPPQVYVNEREQALAFYQNLGSIFQFRN
ncbi:hypothetical protein ACA910_004243 [Epithemia clementina (nom. ined.)]